MSARPAGTTLLELLVVLVILGILWGIGAAAMWSLTPPALNPSRARWEQARVSAIRTGRPVLLSLDRGRTLVRFLPDGRVLGRDVNEITGGPDSTWGAP